MDLKKIHRIFCHNLTSYKDKREDITKENIIKQCGCVMRDPSSLDVVMAARVCGSAYGECGDHNTSLLSPELPSSAAHVCSDFVTAQNIVTYHNKLVIDKLYLSHSDLLRLYAPQFAQDNRFARILLFPPCYDESEFVELELCACELRKKFDSFVIIGMGGAILNPMSVLEFGKYCTNDARNNDEAHDDDLCYVKDLDECDTHKINNTSHKHRYGKTSEHTNNNEQYKCGKHERNPDIYYCNYLDPLALEVLSRKICAKKTAFIVISRSGNTAETLVLTQYWYNHLAHCGVMGVDQHFVFISSMNDSETKFFAEKRGCARYFFYPPDMGGRFATFTIINILPGLIAGLDMREFCKGGSDVFNDVFYGSVSHHHHNNDGMYNEVIKGVAALYHSYDQGYHTHVTVSYVEYLRSMLEWQSQIFAESLSKNEHGILHTYGIGPQEQHSHLSTFLEPGQHKILFTILTLSKNFACNTRHVVTQYAKYGSEVQNTKYGRHNNAEQMLSAQNNCMSLSALHTCCNSTVSALQNAQKNVRTITIHNLNMATLGALMMRSIIEVILLSNTIGVNPYTQPSIENVRATIFDKLLKS